VPILVDVDMVGCSNAVHPEVRGNASDAELQEDIVAEILIKRIFLRKMADVFHKDSPFTMAAGALLPGALFRIMGTVEPPVVRRL